MKIRKNPKLNMENKKGIFFQIGLILALIFIFTAFEYRTYEKISINDYFRDIDNTPVDVIPITIQKQKPPPPPPPPLEKIKIVDEPLEKTKDIILNAGVDQNTVIPVFEPEMPDEVIFVDEPIVLVPEIQPEFPGGPEELYRFLRENVKYPRIAKEIGIQGTTYIGFIVEKDGSISNIKILRQLGGGCDEEAARVVKSMPNWKPGKQMNKPVRVSLTLPIKFSLH